MHIKKLILFLFLVPVFASAQKTTGANYTYIAQRYEWLAGVFKALGLPAGDSAQFQPGQEMRAGAVYYDSVGVDSGLYVWSGLAWIEAGGYTDADARAAISLTTTGTSGAATYSSATGVFNIPVYAGTLNANAGAFYRWLKPATQEIKTFANGYGFILDSTSNTDAITAILDSATVFPDIRASIEPPNLIVDSIGVSGTDVIVARNDSLLHRLISTGYNYILVDTLSTGEIRIRLDTASATFKAYIAANSGAGSGNWALAGNAGTTAGTDFLGTTDAQDLVFKTNSTENFRLNQSTGNGTFANSIQIGDGSSTVAALKFFNAGSGNLGFYRSGSNLIGVSVGSTEYYRFSSSAGFVVGNSAYLGLGSTVASPDVRIQRDAAAIMALKNSTNAQEFRIYNTDATDDEYASIGFLNTANVFTIETEKTGSATIRDIELKSGTANTRITKLAGSGTRLVTADASGNLATKALVTLTKNATIESPASSENIGWFRTPVAITVTNTHAVLVGSGSPSVTYQISFGTDITSLTNVYTAGQTVTSTTTGTAASGVNDATIPADSWIRITTSAATDVTQISLSITYTED